MKKNEKQKNLEEKELIKLMMEKFQWVDIKKYILQMPSLINEFKKGGFEFKSKNKSHAINVVLNNLNEEIKLDLFFIWYKKISGYSDSLDKYFEPAEYNEFVKSKKIKDGEYMITSLQFVKLYYLLSKIDAQIFLHLSPIKFTKEQKQALSEIPDKVERLNDKSDAIEKKYEDALEKIRSLKSELSILQKEKRSFQKESSKSKELIDEIDKIRKEKDKVQAEKSKELINIEADQKLAEHRMIEKYDRCEKEKSKALEKAKELKNLLDQARKKIELSEASIIDLQKKIKNYEKDKETLFHNILEKINLHEIISELNEPDEVKELLDTIVKVPEKDDREDSEKLGIKLQEFWQNSLELEEKILKKILSIDAASVMKGSYFKEWGEHADNFVDLKQTLRAKIVLINLLYEILRKQQL